MTRFQKDIFALIKSSLLNVQVIIEDDFDWSLAKECGKKHKILPLLFYGAYNSQIKIPEEIEKEISLITTKHLIVSERQLFELNIIKKKFAENNIDFVVLKGSVQKMFYPKTEMRPMGDIDILIKIEQYDKISNIMVELGYTAERESDHELIWIKPGVMIELHKRIIPSYNADYYKYFGDGWKLAKPGSEFKGEYIFSPEDNFIYLFTHFSKHYRDAGIGILHLVDLYVYLNANKSLDIEYIENELKKLELYEFYNNIIYTLKVCFEDLPEVDISSFIVDKIFESGSYGSTKSQAMSIAVKKTKNIKNRRNIRIVLFFKRVFMPYKEMCRRHPILKKAPCLLPFLWVYRIIYISLFKRRNIKKEITYMRISDSNSVIKYYDELKYVGLDFNFDE